MNNKSPYVQNSVKDRKPPSPWAALLSVVIALWGVVVVAATLYAVAFVIAAGASAGWN